MPFLTNNVRLIVVRIDQKLASSYTEVKTLLLRECKLTSWAYR